MAVSVENFESTDDRDEDIVWQTAGQTNHYNFFIDLQWILSLILFGYMTIQFRRIDTFIIINVVSTILQKIYN